MIKSKKQMFLVITIFTLVMMLGTISYAFFNYTRTGNPNNISVGRVNFRSKNEQTITINDLFPIDPSTPGIMNDSTKVGTYEIEIEGDTDYSYGLEYLVSTEDVHIYTSEGKTIPVSLNITVSNLGNESSTYFTSRNTKDTTIYKRLTGNSIVGEQQLLVGYIKPNTENGTAEGVNGKITIKAYIDKDKIAITNTSEENVEWQEGRAVITEEEWNALQSTGIRFKIKVEANAGIWVNEPFYDVMQRSAVMDNINSTYVNNTTPGIDFTKISSDTNGKGLYTLSRTANDTYPIMYYRGDVDNNVLFGGFCWKIVRTTETGGIKLIYNGNPVNNQCGADRIIEKNQQIAFKTENVYGIVTNLGDNYEYDSVNKVFVLTGNVSEFNIDSNNINSLVGKYLCNKYQDHDRCSSLLKIDSFDSQNDEIVYKQITLDSSIMLSDDNPYRDNTFYNSEVTSPASMGYMYGTNYMLENGLREPGKAQSYFGSNFTYENGVYKLVDPVSIVGNAPLIGTHHYTCGLTDPNGTCESIWYYTNLFISNGSKQYNYIVLSNGKSVEDALNEMFVNTHESLAKLTIESWYSENMVNYTSKLEDTIYCNNRKISHLGGFNPYGGEYSYNNYQLAFANGRLKCEQKKDSFSVNSEIGNGMLNYPVGMLDRDEVTLAGAIYGLANPNITFYLYDGNGYWLMSPNSFQLMSYVDRVYFSGNLGGTRVDHSGYMSGFRPVVSLKQGTSVTSGDGTPTNPYIIK